MDKHKRIKVIAIVGVVCLVLPSLVFGAYKYKQTKSFNEFVSAADGNLNAGNYDQAIALYNQALQIKNDTGIKNQLFLAQNFKLYQSNVNKANDKDSSVDRKTDATSGDDQENISNSFTEEEKKLLAQASNININEPIVNGNEKTSNNYVSTNKSSNSKKYSYSTQKSTASSTKLPSSNSSNSGNIASSNSSSNTSNVSSSDSSSNTNSNDSNIKYEADSNNSLSKKERIDALYQQEQKDLAPYIKKINELKQQSSQLTLEANALPEGSARKLELLQRKATVEQEVVQQLNQCKIIANDYLRRSEAIQSE